MTATLPTGSLDGPLDAPPGARVDVPPPLRLGRLRLYARRFARNRSAVVGVIIFVLLVAYSVLGGLFTPWDWSRQDFLALTQPPSGSHWFGTNQGGNDIYAQSVHGLQRSLVIALSVSVLTIVIAAVVGAGAAYLGGRVERWALALIHFLLVVPSFLILALVSNRVSGDWRVLIPLLTVFGWMFTARVIWSVSTSLRERDYVLLAEFMGVSRWRIVLRHIIPHLGALLIVNFTLGIVSTVLAETSLSFLGFGVKTPDVSLGSLLADGSGTITSAPWLFAFPAGLLVLLTVSVTLIGDGLRDALDPTSMVGGRA
ncbi:ABC transporter permease [Rugosimonospora africana]|uniref:Oligopeptide transport system permease protein OppC n=1 Tax=Rugosimonospora africana TaxID=556532 RepID=A0A8J3R1P6_9ACTN|nr:ABC transporter permease [Rugosimonospora africana]GIH20174.1 peptide ABC transporter permease [Rugosimonospora africana]